MFPDKTTKYFAAVFFGTLTGAIAGYFIGHAASINDGGKVNELFDLLVRYIPGFSTDFFDKIYLIFKSHDFWILSGSAFAPVPYVFFSITAGL